MNSSDKKFKHIVLIDDDPIINHINKRLLEIHSIADTITTFSNPEEGLEYLKQDPEPPEIIFLDIQMPAMDGFEFLEAYEKLNLKLKSQSKIVVLSSTEHSEDVGRIRANKNVFAFMNKPLDVKHLNSLLINSRSER